MNGMDGIEEFRRPGEWGFRGRLDMAVPCPLGSCTWTLENDGVTPAGRQPHVVKPEEAPREIAKAADVIILKHLQAHSLIEWVQEVARLRGELEAARRAIRAEYDGASKMGADDEYLSGLSFGLESLGVRREN